MAVVSPADLAARITLAKSSGTAEGVADMVKGKYAAVAEVARALGLDLVEEIQRWIDRVGLEGVKAWTQPEVEPSKLLTEWTALKQAPPGVVSSLLAEHRLGEYGAEIGAYLHSARSSYEQELQSARWLTARALKQRASAIPFFEQILLTRTCNLTRMYYESLRPFSDAGSESALRVEREIARLTVTSARFSAATVSQLDNALAYLESATNDPHDLQAASLRLEVLVELYHVTASDEHLKNAIRFARRVHVADDDWPQWHVTLAEVYLDLVEHATPNAKLKFLERALEVLNSVLLQNIENVTLEIRAKLLRALARYCLDNPGVPVRLRNVRLPFLLRTAGELPAIVTRSAQYLISSLQSGADRGQFQHREFLAELNSRISRELPVTQRASRLREAVRLRNAVENKAALEGTRDQMAQALDLLALHHLGGDEEDRSVAIDILLGLHRRDRKSSEPLVLLARELEQCGPDRRLHPGHESALIEAVRSGDYRAVLTRAAKIAFTDQSLRVRGLGGRGATFTVADFSGFTGQTFVFKESEDAALSRDESRAHRVERRLKELDLAGRFGVIEHIEKLTLEESHEQPSRFVSVRRYAQGDTLRHKLQELSSGMDQRDMLASTAEFLALIHSNEEMTASEQLSARREIKLKELGRWLKRLFRQDDVGEMYADWWSMVAHVPLLPRRDAHSLNWIVADDGRILAADFESQGARPALYELAQLVEDEPVLEPNDDATRFEILDRYVTAMGLSLDNPRLVYQACSAARSVGILSDPKSSQATRERAYRRILHLSHSSTTEGDAPLTAWTQRIAEAWQLKVGLTDPTRYKAIAPGDRVRISKAMSYHLRHDPTAPVTKGGWIFAEDLAEIMQANGHKVTPEQLLVVAGALGEPRFELDNSEIRASYGHSSVRRDDFIVASAPQNLYHATLSSNLSPIFSVRGGLTAQARQFVHLTPDLQKAHQAGALHGERILILKVAGTVPGMVRAASDTWLAPSVSVSALRVPSIGELWLDVDGA